MKKKHENESQQHETSAERTVEHGTQCETKNQQQEFDDLTDTLKRLQAEFENYKKRTEKENMQVVKNANAALIKDMLPVLDSFELAIKNANGQDEGMDKFRKGLELIHAQIYSILESRGLRAIDTKNQKFDPFRHEVLLVNESDKEDDMILQEFQKGYMLNDHVLRHAKVMISRHNAESNQGVKDEQNP